VLAEMVDGTARIVGGRTVARELEAQLVEMVTTVRIAMATNGGRVPAPDECVLWTLPTRSRLLVEPPHPEVIYRAVGARRWADRQESLP
jgi:hypothetical protein